VLPNGLVIASARANMRATESLQRAVFPTLADEERFKAALSETPELFPPPVGPDATG
jgi:hypothetical protein